MGGNKYKQTLADFVYFDCEQAVLFHLTSRSNAFFTQVQSYFMTALFRKKRYLSAVKSDVYVTHRNGPARKRAYSQVKILFKYSENKTF